MELGKSALWTALSRNSDVIFSETTGYNSLLNVSIGVYFSKVYPTVQFYVLVPPNGTVTRVIYQRLQFFINCIDSQTWFLQNNLFDLFCYGLIQRIPICRKLFASFSEKIVVVRYSQSLEVVIIFLEKQICLPQKPAIAFHSSRYQLTYSAVLN